jgi:hypothetical protein
LSSNCSQNLHIRCESLHNLHFKTFYFSILRVSLDLGANSTIDRALSALQDFKLGGRAEGGANIFGVFRMKNHGFTPKNHIFFNCWGRREHFWGISCEKSRFYKIKGFSFNHTNHFLWWLSKLKCFSWQWSNAKMTY